MAKNKLRDESHAFVAAFNAGDAQAILGHYEADAVFINEAGEETRGHAALKAMLDGFMAMKPRLEFREGSSTSAGDLAVNWASWTLTGTGPDGAPMEMQGRGYDVMRRQSDGSWKMVIDSPWGH